MATKNDKLLEFYSECQKNGYTNMKDETQSLKAKVIASDLGLNYSKIVALYEEAKKVAEEKARLDNKRGNLVFSCYKSSFNYEKESPILELYRCDDGSHFCIVEGEKIHSSPYIYSETAVLPQTYHREPSTTYYGVAYNGVATGTVSYDPGGETTRMEKTGRAYIVIKVGEQRYPIKSVKPSPEMLNAFKRDVVFKRFFDGTVLVLDNISQAGYSNDIYDTLRQTYLPLEDCQNAVELLRRMIDNQLPPSDQELYKRAIDLSSSDSSENVKKAIEAFELISDYKDSSEQKDNAEKRLPEVIQLEKEAAIIREERNKKAFLKTTVVLLFCTALAVASFFGVKRFVIPEIHYHKASQLLLQEDFDAAISAYQDLGDYRDSSIKVTEALSAKKESLYMQAMELYNKREYSGALKIFSQITGYKDVDKRLDEDRNLVVAAYKTAGSTVSLGNYEQDNITTNGKERIKWTVLYNNENRSLLISQIALDVKPFHDDANIASPEDFAWENCSLRRWLNGYFFKAAFSTTEKSAILQTTIDNSASQNMLEPQWASKSGNDTEDKVFLLSCAEARKYMLTNEDRIAAPSNYAKDNDKDGSCNDKSCEWWLRSRGPGSPFVCVCYIKTWGSLDQFFTPQRVMGVRPAIWVDLESDYFE